MNPVLSVILRVFGIVATCLLNQAATNHCLAPLPETVLWIDGAPGGTNLSTGTAADFYGGTSVGQAAGDLFLHLSGVSSSHLEYKDGPAFKLDRGDVISLEMWVRTTNKLKTDLTLIDKRTSAATGFTRGYAVLLENGKPYLLVAATYGADYIVRAVTPDLRDGTFHHLVFNIDRRTTSAIVEIYVDGELVAKQATEDHEGSFTNEGELRIGQSVMTSYNSYFEGELDDIQIHRRKLSAAEVSTRFAACFPKLDSVETCAEIPRDIIGWWRGDGDTRDAITGLSATADVAVSYSQAVVNQGIILQKANGTPLRIPNAHDFNFATNEGFTIEGWVKLQPGATGTHIIFQHSDGVAPGTGRGYAFHITANRLQLNVFSSAAESSVTAAAPQFNFQDGLFHHIAVAVLRASNSTGVIYIDGAAVHQFSMSGQSGSLSAAAGATIGGQGAFNFPGVIDELAIYRRALAGDEIRAIRDSGVLGRCIEDLIPSLSADMENVVATVPAYVIARIANPGTAARTNVTFAITSRTNVNFSEISVSSGEFYLTGNGVVISNVTVSAGGASEVFFTLNANDISSNVISARILHFADEQSTSNDATTRYFTPLPACEPTSTALMAWLRGEGTSADAIGTGHPTNRNVSFRPGRVGNAFFFGGEETYLEFPDRPEFNFPGGQFSIDLWVKPDPSHVGDYFTILDKRVVQNDASTGYGLLHHGSTLAFQMGDANMADRQSIWHFQTTKLLDGQFHHVAVTVNHKIINGGAIYFDGALLGRFNPNAEPLSFANSALLRIGRSVPTTVYSQYGGLMDEIALSGRVLTAEEVRSLYNRGSQPRCATGALLVRDSDFDLMDDQWETRFGLNPYDPRDAELDTDADGTTNLVEYDADTDPTSAASGFEISGVRLSDSGEQIEFRVRSRAGTTHTLEDAPTPQGPWTTHTVKGGNGEALLFTISDHLRPGQIRRYYRVRAQPTVQ